METIKLKRVGRNNNGYTAYKDEQGQYYFDLSHLIQSDPAILHEASPSNDINGEPGFELNKPFIIVNPYTEREIRMYNYREKYMLLSMIYNQFNAFLGKTGDEEQDRWDCRYHNKSFGLWGGTIEETLEEIKKLWNAIPNDIKPEWCTAEDIEKLEQKAMATSL